MRQFSEEEKAAIKANATDVTADVTSELPLDKTRIRKANDTARNDNKALLKKQSPAALFNFLRDNIKAMPTGSAKKITAAMAPFQDAADKGENKNVVQTKAKTELLKIATNFMIDSMDNGAISKLNTKALGKKFTTAEGELKAMDQRRDNRLAAHALRKDATDLRYKTGPGKVIGGAVKISSGIADMTVRASDKKFEAQLADGNINKGARKLLKKSIYATVGASILAGTATVELPKATYGDVFPENDRIHNRVHDACMDPIVTSGGAVNAATYIALHKPEDSNRDIIIEHIKTANRAGMPAFITAQNIASEVSRDGELGYDLDARHLGNKSVSRTSALRNSASGPNQFINATKIDTWNRAIDRIDFGDDAITEKAARSLVKEYRSSAGRKELLNDMKNFKFDAKAMDIINVASNHRDYAGQLFTAYHLSANPELHISKLKNASLDEMLDHSGETYIYHFSGHGGGEELEKLVQNSPNITIAQSQSKALKNAYESNPHLFPEGMQTTAKQVWDGLIEYGSRRNDKLVTSHVRGVMKETQDNYGEVTVETLCRYGSPEIAKNISTTATPMDALRTKLDSMGVFNYMSNIAPAISTVADNSAIPIPAERETSIEGIIHNMS